MSETVHYQGKIKKIKPAGNWSNEEFAQYTFSRKGIDKKAYYKTYLEALCDMFYDEFLNIGADLYEILEKKEIDTSDDIFRSKESGGEISFEVKFYNGGCSFREAIEFAINNKE